MLEMSGVCKPAVLAGHPTTDFSGETSEIRIADITVMIEPVHAAAGL